MKLASDEVTTSVEDEDEEGETTLYFDAEEGTFRDADGDEVTFEMGESEDAEGLEEDEEQGDEQEEGSQTPQATQRPQTITSTFTSSFPLWKE